MPDVDVLFGFLSQILNQVKVPGPGPLIPRLLNINKETIKEILTTVEVQSNQILSTNRYFRFKLKVGVTLESKV
jgi:hypothetical protein